MVARLGAHTPEGRTCAMNRMGTGDDCRLSWGTTRDDQGQVSTT
jgi:hypothetical protein